MPALAHQTSPQDTQQHSQPKQSATPPPLSTSATGSSSAAGNPTATKLTPAAEAPADQTGNVVTFKTNILTPSSYPVPTFTPERLRFLASSPTSPNLPTSTLITITGDGHCVLRLAGEICAYLANPDHLSSGRAACLNSNLHLKQEKKQKQSLLTNWLTEKSKIYPLLQDLDNVVFEEVNDTISQFYERTRK